jgi:hypothetical protein
MPDKRIYDLTTTTSLAAKYFVVDKAANAEAEKFDATQLVDLSSAQSLSGQKTITTRLNFADATAYIQNAAGQLTLADAVTGSKTLAQLSAAGVSIGTNAQIPYVNVTNNDFLYSSNLIYNTSTQIFYAPNIQLSGLAAVANRVVVSNTVGKLINYAGLTYDGTTLTVASAIQTDTLRLVDVSTTITRDGANNLSFTDAVTGTRTLAQLATPAITFGATTQIPRVNAAGTDFIYTATLVFDGTNFGIGTATPGHKLVVNSNGSSNTVIRIDAADARGASRYALHIVDADPNSRGSVRIETTTGPSITTTGFVGIGTTGPLAKLDVYGTIATPGQIMISNPGGTWVSNDVVGEYVFYSRDASGIGARQVGSMKSICDTPGASAGFALAFSVGPYNGTISEAMRILDDGNVGINTTSPSTQFCIGSDNGENEGIKMYVDGAALNANSYIQMMENANDLYGAELAYDGSTNQFHIGVRDNSATVNKRIIINRSNGYVLIGGAGTPAYVLDVLGTGRFQNTLRVTQTGTASLIVEGETTGAAIGAQITLISTAAVRGRGLFFKRDDGVHEWFAGIGYNMSDDYTIGYDATGGQSEYTAQSYLKISTAGVFYFYPAYSSNSFTISSSQTTSRTPLVVENDTASVPLIDIKRSSSTVVGGILRLSNTNTAQASATRAGEIQFYKADVSTQGAGLVGQIYCVAIDAGGTYDMYFRTGQDVETPAGTNGIMKMDYTGDVFMVSDLHLGGTWTGLTGVSGRVRLYYSSNVVIGEFGYLAGVYDTGTSTTNATAVKCNEYTNANHYTALFQIGGTDGIGGIQHSKADGTISQFRIYTTYIAWGWGTSSAAYLETFTVTQSALTFKGQTTGYAYVTGRTSTARLYISSGSTSTDAAIYFRQITTTVWVCGYDDSQTAFQIHNGTGFATLATADFSIDSAGEPYFGNVTSGSPPYELRYNTSSGKVQYASTSDRRLKSKITLWKKDALASLLSIPVSHFWHKQEKRFMTGPVAQDIQPHIPEMVAPDPRSGMLILSERVYYSYFHRAIQQLHENHTREIAELKEEIEQLKNQ